VSLDWRTDWLDERAERGHRRFDGLVDLAGANPVEVWRQLSDREAWPDADVAEALSAGIARGLHQPRFPRLVEHLASDINSALDPRDDSARPLPALRRFLWAAAIGVASLGRREGSL
jgi:hypothetical protein